MSLGELNAQMPLGPVFFDYDQSEIRADARAALQANAAWMKGDRLWATGLPMTT